MNMSNDEQRDPDELEAPPELVDALRDLHNERLFIPGDVDDAILAQARKHFEEALPEPAPNVTPMPWWSWAGWAVAAAAVVVMVVDLSLKPGEEAEPSRIVQAETPAFAAEDMNQDQRIDILDAFALARELKGKPGIPTARDFNGDGVIDQQDVDWLARRSVRLEGGI